MEQEGTSGIQALDTPVLMYQGKGSEPFTVVHSGAVFAESELCSVALPG